MRILSARITRARRVRATGRVEAIVALTVDAGGGHVRAHLHIAARAAAPGAPPLRERLLAAAKLKFAVENMRRPAPRDPRVRAA